MNKPLNKIAVHANINGESTAFLCSPGQVLAEVLRDELELIGTKIGCNTGDCGACSCLLYTSPSPRDYAASRMPSSA